MLLPTLRRQTFSSFLLSFFISKALTPLIIKLYQIIT
nr:MAG TPA: hypothetical protein [Caudoviricetes sp.]